MSGAGIRKLSVFSQSFIKDIEHSGAGGTLPFHPKSCIKAVSFQSCGYLPFTTRTNCSVMLSVIQRNRHGDHFTKRFCLIHPRVGAPAI